MKKIIALVLFVLCSQLHTSAQSLGLGASFNNQSNGAHLYYAKAINKNWDIEAGVRIMVNTYSLNENKNFNLFYQTGYAMHFPEYFGLNLRLSRKLVTYKMFRLDAMTNLLATHHSLLIKSRIPIKDANGNPTNKNYVLYYPPALSLELTLGLKLKIQLNDKIALMAASGIGINYFRYDLHFRSKVKEPFLNDHSYEYVGLEGLPMMFVGATYSISDCKWFKKKNNYEKSEN